MSKRQNVKIIILLCIKNLIIKFGFAGLASVQHPARNTPRLT